jgi:hypothetical protein
VTRVTRIYSEEDFEMEARREILRDWRWQRRWSMICASACLIRSALLPLAFLAAAVILGLHAQILTLARLP